MTRYTWLLVAAIVGAGTALAQDPAPPTSQPDRARDEAAPPTLDELLGLDEADETDDTAADVAEQEHQDELERRLNEVDIAEVFEQALAQMDRSAERLDEAFDPGLGTQRIQEDVLAKLDQLIEEAQRQGESSSSSSSSSSSQQQQQQQNPGRQQQGQQQQEQGQQSSANEGSDGSGGDPAAQQGAVNPMLEETRAEWGNLPERVRDMLMQGSRDAYSSLYDQLTSEYYRRLAEEVGN